MRYLVFLAILSLLSSPIWAADGPSKRELKKISETKPVKATASPKAPRKLLVFSLVPTGYVHSSIPYGKAMIEALAKNTGAFQAVFTDDIGIFEPARLAEFDAVFFNNANNELFLPADYKELTGEAKQKAEARDAALKKSLVDYIRSGKGVGFLHASLAIFREWEEFGNIIGGRFDNHPWNTKVTIRVEEPGHPLLGAFEGDEFVVADEIYQVKGPYSRDTHRILLSLDLEKSPKPKVANLNRTDKDFALAWIKPYGEGKVFYCGLGHLHNLFWNPVYQQFVLDGIQFILGDIEADMTPSAKLKK